jgi:hypothetical protein
MVGNLGRRFTWLLTRKKQHAITKALSFLAQSLGFSPHGKTFGTSDEHNYYVSGFSLRSLAFSCHLCFHQCYRLMHHQGLL